MGYLLDMAYLTAAAATSPYWLFRLVATGKWRTDWSARLGRCDPLPSDRPVILLHAVSLGEVNAIRLLVEQLNHELGPAIRLVIASTTDAGIFRARQLFEPDHRVVRFPLDLSWSVRRFLDAVQPSLVVLVELELWPNFLAECRRRNIPVCLVNGRLSERSYRRYRLVRPLIRRMFRTLSFAAVQTAEYARRFIDLGTPPERVRITDSMKWDTAQIQEPDQVPGATELAKAMGIDRSRPLIVAGSTGPGEEALLLKTCPPQAQLLIAPRKPERFDQVAALEPAFVRRSQHPDGTVRPCDGRRFFLLDTLGELRKAYALADVCIVGRSFLGLFGSDVIEPAALGKPVIVGPHHADFRDIVQAFVAGDGILVTAEPGPAAAALLADSRRARQLAENARRVILSRQGATRRHAELIQGLLKEQCKKLTDRTISRNSSLSLSDSTAATAVGVSRSG